MFLKVPMYILSLIWMQQRIGEACLKIGCPPLEFVKYFYSFWRCECEREVIRDLDGPAMQRFEVYVWMEIHKL